MLKLMGFMKAECLPPNLLFELGMLKFFSLMKDYWSGFPIGVVTRSELLKVVVYIVLVFMAELLLALNLLK